jgi:hypothetical protein
MAFQLIRLQSIHERKNDVHVKQNTLQQFYGTKEIQKSKLTKFCRVTAIAMFSMDPNLDGRNMFTQRGCRMQNEGS